MTIGEHMFEHVLAAKKRLQGNANVTPIMTSRTVNRLVGAKLYFKCENFQRVGAFKFRGAFNSMSRLSKTEKAKGVITYSSGNHAQAVALVGRILNIQTYIVMPNNAPETKREATEDYGAHVIAYDPEKTTRENVASDLANKNGYTIIPPFDHPDVIAGQGTAALEMFEDLGHLDMLLVPCGGGGLL
ncbi:MAG: pyridoxal-phosphate dependent enzyme, partial [Desulfobacterales bacterium]